MKRKKGIINGIVYRDGKLIRFISLYDEKIRNIEDDIYLTFHNNAILSEKVLVLVEYTMVGSMYKTKPIVAVDLFDRYNNAIVTKKLRKDDMINYAYKAAICFLSQ